MLQKIKIGEIWKYKGENKTNSGKILCGIGNIIRKELT
jgi:hypothetical protein